MFINGRTNSKTKMFILIAHAVAKRTNNHTKMVKLAKHTDFSTSIATTQFM